MSDIKWCDVGGHAFSANDMEARSYVETNYDDSKVRQRIDICGPCNNKGTGVKSLTMAPQPEGDK